MGRLTRGRRDSAAQAKGKGLASIYIAECGATSDTQRGCEGGLFKPRKGARTYSAKLWVLVRRVLISSKVEVSREAAGNGQRATVQQKPLHVTCLGTNLRVACGGG